MGTAFPTYGAYAASKGAVEVLTRVLAKELGEKKISVNAVAPGPTATDLFLDGKSDQQIESSSPTRSPSADWENRRHDDLVAFLVSPAGRWVSGQVIRANGGMVEDRPVPGCCGAQRSGPAAAPSPLSRE